MNDNDFVRKDVYEAQTDNILTAVNDTNTRIDDMKERINDVKDSVNRSFTMLSVLFTVIQFGLALLLFFIRK